MVTTVDTNATLRLTGEAKLVSLPDVESGTVVVAGTTVCQKSGDVRFVTPASTVSDAGDAAANREAAADLFRGFALDASPSGTASSVRVTGKGTQLWVKQATAAAIHQGDTLEIFADADNAFDNTFVEGSTSQVLKCIETKLSTVDVWVLCEQLASKIDIALEQD